MATKQDINKLLEICWDWTSELTNPDDIDTQELVELVHEVIGKQTKSEDDLAHELYGVDNDVEVRITPQRDKELRQKYPANVEGTLEFRIAALEDAVTKQLNLVNKLLNIIEKTNK